MLKKFIVLTFLSLGLVSYSQADFSTGFATGFLLGSGNEVEPDYSLINAKDLSKFTQRQNLEDMKLFKSLKEDVVFKDLISSIIAQASKGEFSLVYQTGIFNTESNNWFKVRKTNKHINDIMFFLELRGFKLTQTTQNNELRIEW